MSTFELLKPESVQKKRMKTIQGPSWSIKKPNDSNMETASIGSNPYVEPIKNFSRHRSLSKELHMLNGDDLVSKFKLIQAKNKKV